MKPQDARTLSPDALFDLRTRVTAAVRGGMSQSEAARVFGVHRSAVNRWCQVAADGPDALRPRRRGRKPTGGPLTPHRQATLLGAIRDRHPDDLRDRHPVRQMDDQPVHHHDPFGRMLYFLQS